MKTFLSRSRWAAIGAAVAVSLGGGAVFVANAALTEGDRYVPIEPCRLLDTRPAPDQTGVRSGKIGPTQPISADQRATNDITVYFDSGATELQMGKCNPALISGSPVAAHIVVTVPFAATPSFLTVYPWEQMDGIYVDDRANRPYVSLMNVWKSNYAFSNSVTVGLDTDDTNKKAFRIYNNVGLVDVVVDVLGYYK